MPDAPKGAPKRVAGQPIDKALRRKIIRFLKPPHSLPDTRVHILTGVTVQTVAKIRREEKIPARKSGLNMETIDENIRVEIEKALKEKTRPGDQTIADLYGVSKGAVTRIRRRLGIPAFAPGDHARLDGSIETRERLAREDEIRRLRVELKQALRRNTELEDLRSGILGLGEPKRPRLDLRPPQEGSSARSAIFHLSDIHYAEVIDLDEMDGLNSYNTAIADNRIARSFDTICRLLTDFWKGKPVECLHLCLGGDLVSGGIHPELTRTDELTRLPSAKAVAARIAEGVKEVRRRVGCKVKIYSVPGNHGRLTAKPETKSHAADNLDTLAAWFIESRLSDDRGVEVFYGNSVDCVFEVYGRAFLLSHGDRMGSKGGQGFLGPCATIIRGHLKLRADYATRGIILYKILTGHFHSSCEIPTGFGNGSIGGWSTFARDLRAEKEPARQNFFICHSERGVIDYQKIEPGRPDEGSIYGRSQRATR